MTFAPVPSRLASLIVPLVLVIALAQYRWLASTATPYGLPLPEAMVFAPVPSRLASTIVPGIVTVPWLAQYRWLASTATPAGERLEAEVLAPGPGWRRLRARWCRSGWPPRSCPRPRWPSTGGWRPPPPRTAGPGWRRLR